jgi:hypothetical protein
MTYAEFDSLVKSITYRPGVKLRAYRRPDVSEVSYLHMSALVPSSDGSGQEIAVESQQMVLDQELQLWDKSMTLMMITRLLLRFEEHELNEWLKVNGTHVYEPHPNRMA